MKIFKIVFIGFLLLLSLVFLGIFIFIRTFDVNKYLPQITHQIGRAINRNVHVDHANLGLSLIKGLSLELRSLTISDDTRFSKNDFLVVDKIYVGLDLMPILLKREIHVTNILISSPQVSIVRSLDGQINAQTISPEPPKVSQSAGATSDNAVAPAVVLPALLIKSIIIEHAQISFEDHNEKIPLHILIQNIEAKVSNFSLNEPFDFTLTLNALGQGASNINASGHCSLDLSKTAVHITNFQIKSDLSQWDWGKVRGITPMLENLPVWPQQIKGTVLVRIPQLNASSKGLEGLTASIGLNNGYLKLKELSGPIENISIQAESDLNNLTVKQMQGHIGTGEMDFISQVKGLLTTPEYTFQLQSKAVKIQELLDEGTWPAVLKGALTVNFSGSGASFDPQAMLKNLKGNGDLSLSDAQIEKLNILKTILSKLSFIPGLADKIEGSLSSTVKDKLGSDTTVLDKAQAKLSLQDQVLSITDGQVESKIFSIAAQGTVGLDMTTNIDVKTYLAADLSADLIKSAKQLQGLLDDQNRLYIPGKISGKAPAIGYQPQMDYITKKVAVSEGAQQLEKVLDKNPAVKNILNAVLGGGQDTSTSNTGSSGDQSSQDQNQQQPAQKVINNVLKNIFR